MTAFFVLALVAVAMVLMLRESPAMLESGKNNGAQGPAGGEPSKP